MNWWRGRKVMVTGGAGLVGSHLCDLLVEAGSEVLVVDDLSKGLKERLKSLDGKIRFIQADLRTAESAGLFQGQEVVMHLASKAFGIAYSQDHDAEAQKFNEELNGAVLQSCRNAKVQRLCVVSSSCVYPDDAPSPTPELPVMTGEPEKANAGYGWAKRKLEVDAQKLAKETGIRVTIVRPFNAYSGRYKWEGKYSHVIPSLVKRILEGENPLVIWGSGRQRRNFLHAIDFARCFMAVTEHHAEADPVNVGYEETVSFEELAKMIGQLAGQKFEIRFDPDRPEGRLVKSADSTRLKKVAGGILPSITLEEGLKEMIEWHRRTF